jgi:hypothetical protein
MSEETDDGGHCGKAKRMAPPRPRSITIVASLMIIFGFAEIITGFTHNFFSLHATQGAVSTYIVSPLAVFMRRRVLPFSP